MPVDQFPTIAQIDKKFIEMWLHGKSEKTQRAYRADIHKFYTYVQKPLQGVTLEDFQNFIDSLGNLKPTSQARTIAAVKSALSFGVKIGYLQFNVGAVVKLPKIEDTLAERILSEQQIAKMFALETNPRNHAILILLYRAGLREAELCDLQWRHVQNRTEAGQVAIYGKGKKTRYVLLDQETWREVVALKKPDDAADTYVFQSRQARSRSGAKSRRLDESQIHRIVHAAARRADITGNVSPHWMRHAHATHSIENGAALTLVKETLGHKSIQTTAKYVHVRPNTSSTQFLKI
ncbi:tyrosine recombinase XerC [Ktedonobacteria bacterium brp13]|nr:tyrosine recombinase XerC [Ktedonobacteria bacterium brp13]